MEKKLNYYNEIKRELINNEITKRVKDYSKNKSDLITYYNVGKLLADAGKHYGEGIIKDYSIQLTNELGKGYGLSSLKNMRKFYYFQKSHPVVDFLSWSHYLQLIYLTNDNEINYYINQIKNRNLSKRQLQDIIKNKEYQRLPEATKKKLIIKEETNIQDFVKDPIIIHNPNNIEVIKEKILHKLILEDMEYFLEELGSGFSFIKSEYKIKVGDTSNYIDLLLYNYIYNCFVVIELKVTEFKKEHIGQIEVYMDYIDRNIKMPSQEKTIGIIISKKNNKYLIEYCSDKRILSKEYFLI